MSLKPRLFLDTSALFAGIWSAQGGASMLLSLGEAGALQLVVSAQVLQEMEDVLRRKTARHLPTLAVLLDRSQALVVPAAPVDLIQRCQALVQHPGDARILADAWHSAADYLVTLVRAHFLGKAELAPPAPFPIGAPGDCLGWFRDKITESLNH